MGSVKRADNTHMSQLHRIKGVGQRSKNAEQETDYGTGFVLSEVKCVTQTDVQLKRVALKGHSVISTSIKEGLFEEGIEWLHKQESVVATRPRVNHILLTGLVVSFNCF